jgi:hypothetical protein
VPSEDPVPPKTPESLLGRYPNEVQSLARAARELILRVLPGLDETTDASAPVIGYGYGTGYKGAVCTILLSKTGVKIGLAHGAALKDPDHLMAGSGKVHRFVQLRTDADLREAGLARLLRAAAKAARARLGGGGQPADR